MVISKSSQLGLMFFEPRELTELLNDLKKFLEKEMVGLHTRLVEIDKELSDLTEGEDLSEYDLTIPQRNEGDDLAEEINRRLGYIPENKGAEFYTTQHPTPFYYLIQPSVELCASKIRIKENFSCTVFKKIKNGEHLYLMGKTEFFRFVKFNGVIRGMYWNRGNHTAFEVGFHLEKDQYFFPKLGADCFNRLVRIMTFIELGDVEIQLIEKGRNNGKTKKAGKITNTSNFNVYVVDSSWNKLVIRTEGFAVMGHFRLQPCGSSFSERKLIWINAFEKHGYIRRPKAEIIN